MTVWFDFFSDTRHWELEPYFGRGWRRALGARRHRVLVYVAQPGPVELTVEKTRLRRLLDESHRWRGGEVEEEVQRRPLHREPPDKSHDWVLHVVREGAWRGMNKSYKFESREIVLQEIESNSPKVPFAIEQPSGDIL